MTDTASDTVTNAVTDAASNAAPTAGETEPDRSQGWRRVGPVVLTQIHVDRMIENGRYHHEMIEPVDELWLGPDGVVGTVDGRAILHGHHRLHPNKSRLERPKEFRAGRLLSFGFTAHYDAMAAHFGSAPIGCAAEDVIVETDQPVTLADLAGGIQLRRGDQVIEFTGAQVAKPCVPFTKFLLGHQDADEATVAENRAFLEAGRRGFLVGLADPASVGTVRVADEFYLRS